MQPKTFTFLLVVSSLLILLSGFLAWGRLNRESVSQATEGYAASSHADRVSRSFTNWDNDDTPLVPANCAKCHSTAGFLDFLGEGGLTPGQVDKDAPPGVITCIACHNISAHSLAQVTFSSGARFQPVGNEAVCLACHQSRQSTDSVQSALQELEEDVVSPSLNFINPHYNFAASTQLGGVAHSGYEYPGQEYAGYFSHAARAETCTDCHNPHSLAVEPKKCAACHTNVVNTDDFQGVRMQNTDYDGDGNTAEGIYHEISSLQTLLLDRIQEYARKIAGKPIAYADQFPYFFIDSNDNGTADADEVNRNNRYVYWTPRLLKAAYNYQFVKKDQGGYVHNPYYVIQLLHDSLMDLANQVPLPDSKLMRP